MPGGVEREAKRPPGMQTVTDFFAAAAYITVVITVCVVFSGVPAVPTRNISSQAKILDTQRAFMKMRKCAVCLFTLVPNHIVRKVNKINPLPQKFA